jgi:hypothetical protein
MQQKRTRSVRLVAATLLLAACSARSAAPPPGDSGASDLSAPAGDASGDDGPGPADDAGPDLGARDLGPPDGRASDGSIGAPLCGPVSATSCPAQTAERASRCGEEGAVFFDGEQCQAAVREDCAGERGAFSSFEECAVVCERAGHCVDRKVDFGAAGRATCANLVESVCMLVYWYSEVDITSTCLLDDDISCRFNGRNYLCNFTVGGPKPIAVTRPALARMSLLPFVSEVGCVVGE